jgi:hypothetical protein
VWAHAIVAQKKNKELESKQDEPVQAKSMCAHQPREMLVEVDDQMVELRLCQLVKQGHLLCQILVPL